MNKASTLFLLPIFAVTAVSFSCNRKCASADETGTDIWLGKTHVIAPSAFTPNNQDGINDTYTFFQLQETPQDTSQQSGLAIKIKNFRMEISRSGELLFETYTWGGAWNGKNSKGKKIEGLVDVEYNITDIDGNASEGNFKLFVVPDGCLQECMQNHIFSDMINPYEGIVNQTKEPFCE